MSATLDRLNSNLAQVMRAWRETPEDADMDPMTITATLRLSREVASVLRGNPAAMTAAELRSYRAAAEALNSLDSGIPRIAIPHQTITRGEVIEHLREHESGADTRMWLAERLAITDGDLTNWMTVTLSREALELLREERDTPVRRDAAAAKLMSGPAPDEQRARRLYNEIREALANAKPEEDE